MPRYEYKCESCENRFELRQSLSAEPVAECPVCGSVSRRLIHSVPVVFKGSGFYVNDYGKRGSSSGSSSDAGESKTEKDSKPKPKAESNSDSKAEKKKESSEPGKGSKKESAAAG